MKDIQNVKVLNLDNISKEDLDSFLERICVITGSTKKERNNKPGYRVPGTLRNYFVEEGSLRVYDDDTDCYICIVSLDPQPEGMKALITRIYALHNDLETSKYITTLSPPEISKHYGI